MAYFPQEYPDWSPEAYWAGGILASLAFFTSILAHELGHSLVSMSNGVPVKSITLYIFGGAAHMKGEALKPRTDLMVAVAGPLTSLAVAAVAGALWLATRDASEPAAGVFYWLGVGNAGLAAFNLIPGLPLDGGRVLRALMWWKSGDFERATRLAAWTGKILAYVAALGGFFWALQTPDPDERWTPFWLMFVGLFLMFVTRATYRHALMREILQKSPAEKLVAEDRRSVGPDMTLKELSERYPALFGYRPVPVEHNGRFLGVVTNDEIKTIPRDRWDSVRLGEIMLPAKKLKAMKRTDKALRALEYIEDERLAAVPVMDAGRLVGLITRDSILYWTAPRPRFGNRRNQR